MVLFNGVGCGSVGGSRRRIGHHRERKRLPHPLPPACRKGEGRAQYQLHLRVKFNWTFPNCYLIKLIQWWTFLQKNRINDHETPCIYNILHKFAWYLCTFSQGGNSFVLLGNGDVFVTGGKTDADQQGLRMEPGVRTYIYRVVYKVVHYVLLISKQNSSNPRASFSTKQLSI